MIIKAVIAVALVFLSSSLRTAVPTGLDDAGQLQLVGKAPKSRLTFMRLQNGVQLRFDGVAKNILFYGPTTVRVNTSLARSFTEQQSIVVVAKPAAVSSGANARFMLYEDDNETYDYERGQFATYELTWDDANHRLTIGGRKGSFPGMIRTRTLNIVLAERGENQGIGGPAGASQTVLYDGGEVELNFADRSPR